ncbi:MAG: hypothetical protein HRU20_25260 [Pseudomonadales bacterium]|nr:hypothetical protein [Pseudomonadales bacterium]
MINPDITDPKWIAEREALFIIYKRDLAGEYSRKQIAWIKPTFFEAEFDYGNEKKYGEYATYIGSAMHECPIQTVERWDKWFEDIQAWIPSEYKQNQEVNRIIAGHSQWKNWDVRTEPSWDLATELELFHYYLGYTYQPGPFTFKHFHFEKHPLSPTEFGGIWNSRLSNWLVGGIPDAAIKYTYLMDFGLSCIPFIHPFVLAHAIQVFAKLCANFNPEDAFRDEIEYNLEYDKDYKVEDNGERQKFLLELQEKFLKLDLDPAVFECWEKCQVPGYEIVEDLDDFFPHMPERLHIYDSAGQSIWEDEKFKQALDAREQ